MIEKNSLMTLAVFVLSLGWFYWLSDGNVHYTPDGAVALHTATNIVRGHGVAVNVVSTDIDNPQPKPTVTKPPLFSAVVAMIMHAGLTAREAGLIAVVFASAAAVAFLFLLAGGVLPLELSLLVSMLFMIQIPTVTWGISAHEQSLFVALSLASLWQLLRINRSYTDTTSPYIILGILAALSMLASYQGFPLLLLCSAYILYLSIKHNQVKPILAFGAGVIITAIWPFARFLWLWSTGIKPGFVQVPESAYYKMSAGIASSFQNDVLGRLIVWLYDGSAIDVILLSSFYLLLGLLLLFIWRKRQIRPLVLYAALYLAILIIKLGNAGLESYEPRWSMPIYGLFFLFFVYAYYAAIQRWRRLLKPGIALGILAASAYAYGQVNRYSALLDRDPEMCSAPETYAWIKSNIPAGSVIATTQCGYRLLVESNDHYWLPIPPARDRRSLKRWGSSDIKQVCNASPSAWAIFLVKPDMDPFREKPGYGAFIDRFFTGQASPSTELVAKLEDGLIYRIKCQSDNE